MAPSFAAHQDVGLTRRTVTPTSALLQELLQAHRERKSSQPQAPSTDDNRAPLKGKRQTQSSPPGSPPPKYDTMDGRVRSISDPIANKAPKDVSAKDNYEVSVDSSKQGKRISDSSGPTEWKNPWEMGIKETNAYVDRISKENFNLKLENHHRREREAMLEKRLERMGLFKSALEGLVEKNKKLKAANEALKETNEGLLDDLETLKNENEDLQERNDDLRKEAEERDETVKEAVGIIADLEHEVGHLEGVLVDTRPSTAPPSSPPHSNRATPTTPSEGASDDGDDVDIWIDSPMKKLAAARRARKLPSEGTKDTEGPSFGGPIFNNTFLPPRENTPRTTRIYAAPPLSSPPAASPRAHTADAEEIWRPSALPQAQTSGNAEGFRGPTATQKPTRSRRCSALLGFGRKVSLKVRKRFGRKGSDCPSA